MRCGRRCPGTCARVIRRRARRRVWRARRASFPRVAGPPPHRFYTGEAAGVPRCRQWLGTGSLRLRATSTAPAPSTRTAPPTTIGHAGTELPPPEPPPILTAAYVVVAEAP